MNEWKLMVVLPDGTTRNTRYKSLELERAEKLADGITQATDPNGNALAIRVVSQESGRVISEWEW